MQYTMFLLIMGVALILQTTVLDTVSVGGIKPDLVMLVVVLNGFLLGTREGAFLGFFGGILEDLLCGHYIGLNALSKMAAGYLAGAAGLRLYKENITVATGVTFLSTLGGMVVSYMLLLYLNIHVSPLSALFRVSIPTAVYNALLTPLVFGRIFRYIQIRSREM